MSEPIKYGMQLLLANWTKAAPSRSPSMGGDGVTDDGPATNAALAAAGAVLLPAMKRAFDEALPSVKDILAVTRSIARGQ